MFNLKKLQITTPLIICCLFSPAAFAVDGVLEINHTCASVLGCFSGDDKGYPITIDGSAGRSYRLTSDLIVPDENTNGIEVNTSSVSIDLNGFEIVRSGCEGVTKDCKPEAGSGSGVMGDGTGTSVKNGSVTGMGWNGIDLTAHQSVVEGVRVRWNRMDGIKVSHASLVSNNNAYSNGNDGIGSGIHAITANGNMVVGNGKNGISCGPGSTISANTAVANGNDGIRADIGSNVLNNTVSGNTGYGLFLHPETGYRGNIITANKTGTVFGGFNMGSNFCQTNDTCP